MLLTIALWFFGYVAVGFIIAVIVHILEEEEQTEEKLQGLYLFVMFLWPIVVIISLFLLPKLLVVHWVKKVEQFRKNRISRKHQIKIEKSRLEQVRIQEEKERKKINSLLPATKSLESVD